MVLLILKATDYRMSAELVCSARAIKKFIEHLKPENTFIVLTHCDLTKPDLGYIRNKLRSIKTYTNLDIPIDNVVLFNKTSNSLEEFIANMVEGDMNIAPSIKELAVEYEEELP